MTPKFEMWLFEHIDGVLGEDIEAGLMENIIQSKSKVIVFWGSEVGRRAVGVAMLSKADYNFELIDADDTGFDWDVIPRTGTTCTIVLTSAPVAEWPPRLQGVGRVHFNDTSRRLN